MTKYVVFIHGKDLLPKVKKDIKDCGFYTARFVEANSPDDAIGQAKSLVLEDLKEYEDEYDTKDLTVLAEEVNEIEGFIEEDESATGFAFYEETE